MSVIVNYLLISWDYKTFYILRETPACLVSSCLVDRNSRELAAFRFSVVVVVVVVVVMSNTFDGNTRC